MKVAPLFYKATMRKRIHRHYNEIDQIEDHIDQATTKEQFDACRRSIEQLATLVASGIEVPTTFRNEEYNLRLHIAHVGTQLQAKRQQVLGRD